MYALKLSFIKHNYKEKIFFPCPFYKKWSKNEAKISNLVNIRKNVIQNLEVDIAIKCQINKYWNVWIENQY